MRTTSFVRCIFHSRPLSYIVSNIGSVGVCTDCVLLNVSWTVFQIYVWWQ